MPQKAVDKAATDEEKKASTKAIQKVQMKIAKGTHGSASVQPEILSSPRKSTPPDSVGELLMNPWILNVQISEKFLAGLALVWVPRVPGIRGIFEH